MPSDRFQPGDWVVFRLTKRSEKPGPRAQNVVPARQGDSYSYTVDKFWIVESVADDGSLTLLTRKGKRHVAAPSDLRLRRPVWWQRWWYRSRYEAIEASRQASTADG
ncbi:MAG: hypothetical protein KDA75_20310 [Planctomycetaceae bacterium]|nr:hypothetical protein [Planctomycetaceae bacterium]